MYNVSEDYKTKIRELDRVFGINIKIYHSTGMLELTDKDIAQGSFIKNDATQSGDDFTIGGVVGSDIEFSIVNKGDYENINFIGARVEPTVGLVVKEGIDAHFIQAQQPSKMQDFDEKIEYVPLGIFNIDIADRNRSTIDVKAIDNMVLLDKPYSLSKLSYPASLYQVYTNICNIADVSIGTLDFPNKDYMVETRPTNDLTLRNVLGFVAELAGSFARFNRNGSLEIKWYENTDTVLTPKQRSKLRLGDTDIQVSGVGISDTVENAEGEDEEVFYLVGTEDYALDISGNPLASYPYDVLLNNIFDVVSSIKFRPYDADFNGDPAMESGDIITHIDLDGNEYRTIINKCQYKYRGTSQISGSGLPEIARGFKSTDNRVVSMIERVKKEVGDELTTLEEEILQATNLIGNMLGGYVTEIKTDKDFDYDRFGIGIFIHDNPKLRDSTKIWKWGIGGFGYSDNGGETYETGITAEGSIVAELVTAGIVTADMVQTGILTSEDGETWIDLNTGEINIKNQLRFVDGQLRLQSPDIPDDVDLSGIEQDISNIKNLTPNTVGGGRTSVDSDGIKVTHTGLGGQYSEMRADGFVRKWQYGEAKYLNDIFVASFSFGTGSSTSPFITDVLLPETMRDREIEIYLTLTSITNNYGQVIENGTLSDFTIMNQTDLEIDSRVGNLIKVNNSIKTQYRKAPNWNYVTEYTRAGFTLIAIGK